MDDVFSVLLKALVTLAGKLSVLQLGFISAIILLRCFTKTPAEKRRLEREAFQKRRFEYQKRRLEFDERHETFRQKKLEADERRFEEREKRERQSRQYVKMKKERDRLAGEIRSLRSTLKNRRFSGNWKVLEH